ncbi:unnamed protein product [Adineta steineri]|uniref:G-protein coupled receptors family 1 profile domain-containing protein n=1 Tax=Adineta steineri TaxID=433720 RepID=A0A819Q7D2_9BILA|nr:unnamed protein product [Adineta steineri]CAF4030489.1 unnamed protein product [Adineta steineri]
MVSSNDSLIASINNATIQLNRYLSLIIFVFGIIGNILNILVLSRRALRTNPCALLFLVSSLTGLIVIISGLTTRLTAGWSVDSSETIEWLCKFHIFILFVSRTIFFWLLVFASIDRWFSSSINVHRRHVSTLKNAQRSIIVITIFSVLLNGPLLYCYKANLIDTPAKCYGYSDSCRSYTDISFTLVNIVIPSLLMLLFGLLTINNIRQVQKRINIRASISVPDPYNKNTPTNMSMKQQQQMKTDQNLFKMLFVQVIFLILCTAPYAIYRLYATITPAASLKTVLQNAIESFLFNLFTNLTYLATAMPFYIYTLFVGKVFRNELFSVINDIFQKIKCI